MLARRRAPTLFREDAHPLRGVPRHRAVQLTFPRGSPLPLEDLASPCSQTSASSLPTCRKKNRSPRLSPQSLPRLTKSESFFLDSSRPNFFPTARIKPQRSFPLPFHYGREPRLLFCARRPSRGELPPPLFFCSFASGDELPLFSIRSLSRTLFPITTH